MQQRRQLDRIALSQHMHVHREGPVAQQMVVQRRHLDAAREQLRHDRVHLLLGQDEIAHHHGAVAHFLEGKPAAERETWLQFDAVQRRLDIGARQANAIDAARGGARFAERLRDLLLPVLLGA